MTLSEIKQQLRAMLPELSERYDVAGLWVFGSWAREEATRSSDLDLLVEFRERKLNLFDFADLNLELEDRLGLSVDLVEREALRQELAPFVLSEAVSV